MEFNSFNDDKDILEHVSGLYIFTGIPSERIALVLSKSETVHAQEGEIIFRKGESYHKGVYLVTSGLVELINESGVCTESKDGDFVGLSNFVGKSTYHVSAVTSKETELIFLPELCIYKLMEDYEEFRGRFYGLVTERINILAGREGATIESSTYKAVASYMTSPVITADKGSSVVEASRLMSSHGIGALAVVDSEGLLSGVLTSKNIVQKFLSELEQNIDRQQIELYMDTDPIVLPSEFPLVEALSEMQFKGREYAVVAKKDRPVGIISNNDIMRILFKNINVYNTHIDGIATMEELKKSFDNIYLIAESLVSNTRLTYEILPVITSVHLNIQKRVYRLTAEKYLEETGFDITKVRHTLIIMGSGGRREMMLDPDQDNGFIFGDDVTNEEIDKFMEFGERFVENLDYVGYFKCPGNVMVTNPDMSLRLSEWKHQVKKWVDDSLGKSILWSNIVFDFDGLAGDEKLVWELREYINRKISEKPIFLIYMLENDQNIKRPINLFGRFLTEKSGKHKGEMNLKVAALSFIVDVTRAFTLYKELNDLNTVERLKHLKRKKILSEETMQATLNAYETLVDIVLNEQIDQAKTDRSISKYVNPDSLSLFNQEKLRSSLNHVSKYLNTGLRYFKGHP
ncbi:putative nucleotidyltransferase substrate binding domain-containing protein [Limisalsivibrio acetivorans]|uniref:putative nucleotidyltransferase substrate binding domain-containing protein n=1 Tax=Limisalsivibrio acetivorans TaxID=1304888 RepID=UPI0003B6440F|nr:putative nucleotidyltransferase substrate binding domain-containing protein [Limisalsivibrio acetivorans]